MTQLLIPLKGLGCGKCIKKVTDGLSQLSDTEILSIDKQSVSLNTPHPFELVAKTIEELGYQAGEKIELTLSGLNCGKCVAKVQTKLTENSQVAHVEVSKTNLSVVTLLDESDIIAIVESLGYKAYSLSSSCAVTEEQRDTIATESIQRQAEQTEISVDSTKTTHLVLTGMTCASCVSSVEKACLSVEGVSRVQVNLAEQSALVFLSGDKQKSDQALLQAIKSAGYGAAVIEDDEHQQEALKSAHLTAQSEHRKSAAYALAIGAPLMVWGLFGGNMMIRNPSDQFAWGAVGILCLWLLATAGKNFFINAWKSLRHKRATMDTLVALGTGAAWFYSILVVLAPNWFPQASRHVYFEASAMIVGLISLGHYIEAKAKLRTTESLQALIGLQAKYATVRLDDEDKSVPIETVTKGMHLLIKPGEKIPVDGTVIEGESYVDEAMLTGEPIPKLKVVGDHISAGTINSDGSLLISATGVGGQTMLARIIRLVRQAQSSKPAIAKLADSISAIFVPVVVIIAILSALIWWQFGPEPKVSYMMVVATTVLIIACPCALGLATPLSITVGVGKAAELGILIKDADVLQSASKINTVVFDKTGTLTLGKPIVQEVSTFNQFSESTLLKAVYALESHSEHPLASAICHYAKEQGITLNPVSEVKNFRGKGIQGKVGDQIVRVGSISFLKEHNITIAESDFKHHFEKARTLVAVSLDNQLAGIISIFDPIKKEAAQAVSLLKSRGIKVVLLSGDNQAMATQIAKQVGIKEVIANVLPDEKASHIRALQAADGVVAMVGDGINDAPALAQADIGIAMGSGSDVAIESAQMTLLNSSPIAVYSAIELSQATVKNMKQNLFGAFIYNSIGIPVAAGLLYPMFGFLLSPVVAGAAMALSSITVVSNANRLRLFKPKSTASRLSKT